MPAKFVPRVRKQKQRARLGTNSTQTGADSNASEILPNEMDARREQLRADIRAQQPTEATGKKRKRLDAYIDKKLKKEENLDLIKKLAAQQKGVDTSLFRSAKNLGRGLDTKRETLQRALQERERGLNVEKNEQILFQKRSQPAQKQESDSDSESDDSSANHVSERAITEIQASEGITTSGPTGATLGTDGREVEKPTDTESKGTGAASTVAARGSGLKRPLDLDEHGRPVIKQRKRRKTRPVPTPESESELDSDDNSMNESDDQDESEVESEWGGFSDSENASTQESERIVPTQGHDIEISDDSDSGTQSSEEGSSDDDHDSSSPASSSPAEDSNRSSIFKAWASQQRNSTLGFTPSAGIDLTQKGVKLQIQQPKIPELQYLADNGPSRTVSVVVPRSDEVNESRMKLPVVQEEQKIMEAIHDNSVTVIWGSTGSGKTTQVPQMLFESGYGSKIGDGSIRTNDKSKGMIGVTQPRRVAATSVAERVATEMGSMKSRVGHQVRFDTSVSSSTAIKFMTDGILLREIANDFTLSKYSAIVIDEAHERSVNTDILIGLMSRIVDLRADLAKEKPTEYYPIKLVIMSATLRIEDFTQNQRLFRQGPPPIVQAEGRQFPVVEHFSRKTQRDYVEELYQKVSRGHKKLPAGGMLVFLTGQSEITDLAKRLRQAFQSSANSRAGTTSDRLNAHNAPLEAEDMDGSTIRAISPNDEETEDDFEDEITGLEDDEDREFEIEGEEAAGSLNVHVLPLYSQLPAKEQMRVFQPPPEGSRLIVLATNVAETSLTIPGIRYVFDCGRSKEKHYETATGVQTFEVGWISKASAAQRAGRAGRTGPGHCYRLYSSAVYERDFQEYAVPEILRTPVENVALLVKNVDFPNVANFPFPTPPDRQTLAKAEDLLRFLGAIDVAGKISDTGRRLASYPLSPRYGRMLLLAAAQGLTAHTIALVASMAVPELLLPQNQPPAMANQTRASDSDDSDVEIDAADEEADAELSAAEQRRKAHARAHSILSRWDDQSDALKLLMAFALCSTPNKLSSLCSEYFIREKGMKEAIELRAQLIRIAESQTPTSTDLYSLPILTTDQRAKLKFILAAGFIDQVAIRLDCLNDQTPTPGRKPRRAIEVPYRTLFPSSELSAKGRSQLSAEEAELHKNVYVHPSSVLAKLSIAEMPKYVVYSHLSRAAPKTIGATSVPRTRIHPLWTVTRNQLVALATGTPLLEVGKPIGKIESLGRDEMGKEKRAVSVGLSMKGRDDVRWPLGHRKEIQVRRGGNWVTEKVVG